MGEVVITFKISPESMEVDLDALKNTITEMLPEGANVQRFEKIPLAYGLKALELNFVIDDKKGGTDEFEEKVGQMPNVASITVESVGLA